MTEQEAISVLKMIETHGPLPTIAKDEAIKALEEIQQYRKSGLTPQMANDLIKSEKQAHKDALKNAELVDEYRAIGTPEECRAAVEKQNAKKPKEYEDKFYGCPICGNVLLHKWAKYPTQLTPKTNALPYCLSCGQKLDWSKEE